MVAAVQRVTVRKAAKLLDIAARSNVVLQLNASPGVGKSAIVKAFAKKNNLKLIDIRLSTCAPEDLNGLPFNENGRAVFKPFDFWPLKGDQLPINPSTEKPYAGWLIFLDEFKSAPKSVIAAAYKLVLDRQVGLHDLHENVIIVTASNLSTDRAIVNDPGTAMQSRMAHLVLEVSAQEWIEDVAIPQKYDHRILSFINEYPSKLMDFDPKHNDLTFCCPRTWEFVDRILKTHDKADPMELSALLAGTITGLISVEFLTYCQIFKDVVKVQEILADPENCRIPDDKSLQWATITTMTEHLTTKNFGEFMKYADRFTIPMRIVFYRSSLVRLPEIVDTPFYAQAMEKLANYLNTP